jgi:HlyD family secretion protein
MAGGSVIVLAVVAIALTPSRRLIVRPGTCTRGVVEETVVSSSVGTVEARQTASVAAEVGARVADIRVRQGRVAKGDPVVLLDPAEFEAERRRTEAELNTQKLRQEQCVIRERKIEAELGRLRGTDESVHRIESLEKELAVASKEIDIAGALARVLEETLRLADLRLAKATVTAPFDGTVIKLQTETGEHVTPGRTLFTIQSAPPLLVRAPIDEIDAGRLKLGLEAKVRFDAFRDEVFPGKLIEIMPAASTDLKNNRTVDVKVEVAKMPEAVVAGMSAHVEIVLQRRPDVLRIATPHLREDHATKERYVFVIEGGVARRRPVRTGLWNWEQTEVLEGLKESDVLITQAANLDDSTQIRDGLRVAVSDGK